MANERYKIFKTIDHVEWLDGCPVKLCKSQLLIDNLSGIVVLQNKIQNISDTEIKSVFLDVDCFDDAMDPLDALIDVVYQSIAAKPRDFFGTRQPITMKDSKTTNVKIYVIKVVFADDSVWRNESKESGVILPQQAKIDTSDNLIAQITRECATINIVPLFWPEFKPDYWRCTCGNVCLVNKTVCAACGTTKTWLNEHFDLQYLNSEKAKFDVAQEKIRQVVEEKKIIEARDFELSTISNKKLKKRIVILFALIAVIVAFFIVVNKAIIPSNKYNTAMNLLDNKEFAKASAIFNELGDFKDSKEKFKQYKMLDLRKGDIVTFGNYEQDNNTTTGKEEIEWRVLSVENKKVFLISNKNLDCQQYNKTIKELTWEECSLRTWLNHDFFNEAFTREEQLTIATTLVVNNDNQEYGTDGGNNTEDKVFLLSLEEIKNNLKLESDRIAANTAFAEAQGARTDASGNGNWWLRSPASYAYIACYINYDGVCEEFYSHNAYNYRGVRPALWLNLPS